jgi:hypothetical protein
MGELLRFYATLEDAGECPSCGVRFAIPSNMLSALRQNKKGFYCPNGHAQSFSESSTARLERELEEAKRRQEQAEIALRNSRKRAEEAERAARLSGGKLRALRKRVKNGVCPCCKRSFTQLQRHMATKHPDYEAEGT